MKNILYFILTVLIISCNNNKNNNLQNELISKKEINSNDNNPQNELTDNKEINSNNKRTKSITTKSNKKLNSQERLKYYNTLEDSLLNDSTLYFNDKNKWIDSLITLSLNQFSIHPQTKFNYRSFLRDFFLNRKCEDENDFYFKRGNHCWLDIDGLNYLYYLVGWSNSGSFTYISACWGEKMDNPDEVENYPIQIITINNEKCVDAEFLSMDWDDIFSIQRSSRNIFDNNNSFAKNPIKTIIGYLIKNDIFQFSYQKIDNSTTLSNRMNISIELIRDYTLDTILTKNKPEAYDYLEFWKLNINQNDKTIKSLNFQYKNHFDGLDTYNMFNTEIEYIGRFVSPSNKNVVIVLRETDYDNQGVVDYSESIRLEFINVDLSIMNLEHKYEVPSLLNTLTNIESRKDDLFGDWGIGSDNIYPIGWSKDGKFAYATDSDWGGECGELCYGLGIHIIDLYNNKEDSAVFFHSDGAADMFYEKRDDINSMWNKENIAIDYILSEYNIEQFDSFKLDTSKENIEQFTNYKVSDHVLILDEGVCGVIKNPFNNLDAIIRYEFIEGWEASPPDELHFYVFSNPLSH